MRGDVSGALAALLLCSGCIGVSGAQRARTLGQGQGQLGAGLALQGVMPNAQPAAPPLYGTPPADGQTVPSSSTPAQQMPVAAGLGELYGRYGLLDTLDVGLRVGLALGPASPLLASAQLETKWQFVSGDGLDVSVAPSVGITGPSPLVSVQLPLLFGIALGEGRELVLSPRLTHFLAAPAPGASAGVGLVLPVGNQALVPEVVVGTNLATGGVYGQAGVALLFGDPPKKGR